jgi:hypothetical protein
MAGGGPPEPDPGRDYTEPDLRWLSDLVRYQVREAREDKTKPSRLSREEMHELLEQ